MADKQPDWVRMAKAIHEVLIREWDPIGCGVPDDEYDSYIPEILRLLMDGADEAKIGSHLERIQTVNMALRGNKERNHRIARVLVERTGEWANTGEP